ncbi:MAG: hypothetical protein OCU22_07625 [Canidatus Methanoxibalbensis ujae]|nr:hypothetical protein [Candidatus Methanoxibalbensis ujae]
MIKKKCIYHFEFGLHYKVKDEKEVKDEKDEDEKDEKGEVRGKWKRGDAK